MYYQIGDFSKISKISTRMLRYLDNGGLLKPSEIQLNGYRMYSDKDLERASDITKLKRYRFTYSEIRDILASGLAQDYDLLKSQLSKLKQDAELTELLIRDLENTLNHKAHKYCNVYDVAICNRKKTWQITQEKTLEFDELEAYLDRMAEWLFKSKLTITDHYRLSFLQLSNTELMVEEDFESDEAIHICWKQSVAEPTVIKGFECKDQPEAMHLSTKHFGPYETIYAAYQALYAFAVNNGYVIVGDYEEIYWIDAAHSSDTEAYLTEVRLIVEKKH